MAKPIINPPTKKKKKIKHKERVITFLLQEEHGMDEREVQMKQKIYRNEDEELKSLRNKNRKVKNYGEEKELRNGEG